MLQRHAVQVLHGDKALAFVLAHFVDGADVGVIQRGGRAGFAAETLEGDRVLGHVLRQELEGHKAAEFRVLSLVDHTHAAAADLVDDFVAGKGLADHVPRPGVSVCGWILGRIRRRVKGRVGCGRRRAASGRATPRGPTGE